MDDQLMKIILLCHPILNTNNDSSSTITSIFPILPHFTNNTTLNVVNITGWLIYLECQIIMQTCTVCKKDCNHYYNTSMYRRFVTLRSNK
jgi:hypothetical protein